MSSHRQEGAELPPLAGGAVPESSLTVTVTARLAGLGEATLRVSRAHLPDDQDGPRGTTMAAEGATDLFATAAANAERLEETLKALLGRASARGASLLRRMAERIQRDGRISINMRQTVLNSFFSFGRHQNIYEWARWRAEKSTKSAEEVLREKLGSYYLRRIAFDRHFVNGERFRYGALNIGGPGLPSYGEYCVVFGDRLPSRTPEVAYFASDSLGTYLLSDTTIDQMAISRDAAPHSHRHCLVANKHADQIPATDEDGWPSLLCSDEDYVEAIFTAETRPEDVETIRISWSDFEARFHYAFEEFRGALDPADRYLAEEFTLIWRHLEERKMILEVI
jgi:hypothetical protein